MLAKWEEKGVKVHRMTEAEAEAFKALSAPVYDEFRDELTPELVDAFTK